MIRIDELWIERGEEDTAVARSVCRALPHLVPRLVDDPRAAEPMGSADRFGLGKRRLVLQRHRGGFLEHCPAGTSGMVCCNYMVISLGSNCPMDCSYCFLQGYLRNNPALKVYTNPEDALAEVDRALQRHPERQFRVGTGELVDSLALDPLTHTSQLLVPFFAARANALLELKTKSSAVDGLVGLDGRDRVVVSWSLNPAEIISREEAGTATLDERLTAARRVQAAGYRLGFHFDPLIEYPGWEEGYRRAVTSLAAAVDPERIAWISLGSLRLSPALKSAIRGRAVAGILGGELVPAPDGKLRLWHGLRVKMYRSLSGWLRQWSNRFPIYLCMEGPGVWEQVFAEVPSDRGLGQRLAGPAHW